MPILAATRDASWFSRPDCTSPKKYHVVVNDAAACSGVPLNLDAAYSAQDINHANRCQRPGCRARWPASTDAPSADPVQ